MKAKSALSCAGGIPNLNLLYTTGNGTTPATDNGTTPATGTLIVNKHVRCNFTSVDCPTADKFNIIASTNNGSSYSFNGSESKASLTINPQFPVPYQVKENNPPPGFVIATVSAGLEPNIIAFNPNNGDIYVTNEDSNTVSVIAPLTTTYSNGCNGTIDNRGQTAAACNIINAYGK